MGSGSKGEQRGRDTPTQPVLPSRSISKLEDRDGKDKYLMLPFPKIRPQESSGATEKQAILVALAED